MAGTDDFEQRRRARETANERVVCWIVVAAALLLLATELTWTVCRAYGLVSVPWRAIIPVQIRWGTFAVLATHLAVLGLLARRPPYDPRRKYLLAAMRVALMGLLTWGEWFNTRQDYGLLAPCGGYMMVIVLTGLSFSRRAVLLAGGLGCVVYPVISMLGPTWPLSVRASVLVVQGLLVATLVTATLVDGMLRLHAESVSNERLSRFFAPDVAARITREPEVTVRAVESFVTVLFSDISGFTSRSSTLSPQQVVDLLNAYFPPMVEIVFRHGGTLEKFVGDALLAVWGAPFAHGDDADRAVAAAIEMQRTLDTLNPRLAAAGHAPVRIHIGIASGPAAAGYIGTEQYIQYAVIGDTTNVASRICGVAAAGEILVAESTRALLGATGVRLEPVPPVAVKGKDAPLVLHRVRPSAEAAV